MQFARCRGIATKSDFDSFYKIARTVYFKWNQLTLEEDLIYLKRPFFRGILKFTLVLITSQSLYVENG